MYWSVYSNVLQLAIDWLHIRRHQCTDASTQINHDYLQNVG